MFGLHVAHVSVAHWLPGNHCHGERDQFVNFWFQLVGLGGVAFDC